MVVMDDEGRKSSEVWTVDMNNEGLGTKRMAHHISIAPPCSQQAQLLGCLLGLGFRFSLHSVRRLGY